MFDNAKYSSLGRTSFILNLALRAGSSKQGYACLASTGSNLEVAIYLKLKKKN